MWRTRARGRRAAARGARAAERGERSLSICISHFYFTVHSALTNNSDVYSIKYQPEATVHVHVGCAWSCNVSSPYHAYMYEVYRSALTFCTTIDLVHLGARLVS